MRFFYDTEFVEDGKTIDLISFAIVADDEDFRYWHVAGYDADKARRHEFVSTEVLPHLEGIPQTPREQVRDELSQFLASKDLGVSLWGYFPAYDHVALAQLFGTMMDLPPHIPMQTNDIVTLAHTLRCHIPVQGDRHDALADAQWTRVAFHSIRGQWAAKSEAAK